ncbi:hypothetical protein KP509_1Z302600 [Ceratopteris richardii]|nr:hypothetical protein KP509_1Z302600 [Ceratopteris richardii]
MAPKMNRPMNSKVKDRTSSSPVPALLSEAEKIKKQAERKADGLAKEVLLLQCEKLLQQALANSHSSPKEDEIIFDLGEVYALLGSTAQAKMYYNLGNIFSSKLLKETALNIQSNATKQSGDFYRYSSSEAYLLLIKMLIQVPTH